MCVSKKKKSVLTSMENNAIVFKVIFQFSFYLKRAFRKLEIQAKYFVSGQYNNFQTWRKVVGYGLPASS